MTKPRPKHVVKIYERRGMKSFPALNAVDERTSRDRPKSAPYPRLKNSKRTSKCQFTVLGNRKTKKMDRALKGGYFRNCQNFQSLSQLRGDPLEKKLFRKKVSQCRKTERGDPLGFLNTQSVVKYQRN